MICSGCKNWLLSRENHYEDGSVITTYKAPDGKGNCLVLKVDTDPDFGCMAFASGDHVQIVNKSGAPWIHHYVGPCPDCSGRGSNEGACGRCAGTGKVRYYDDGYVGEERTREHPMEKKLRLEREELKRQQATASLPVDPGTVLQQVKKDSGALTGQSGL